MNCRKKSLIKLLFFSMLLNLNFSVFSQQSTLMGIDLCNSMFNYIEKNGFSPSVQSLVAGGTNSLPYNIIVKFSPKDTVSDNNFILFFYMEDAWQNKEHLVPVFEALSQQNYNSTVVLSFGNRNAFDMENIIYGADVFVQSLDTNVQNNAVLMDLTAGKNAIITGSNRKHAPSWMLKDMFEAFKNARMTDGLPLVFISQVADFTFSEDKAFLAFLNADIPCISAGIKDASHAQEVILSLVESYKTSMYQSNDSHTFMFRFFGKAIWLSEIRLIRLLLVFLILGLLLFACLSFINKNIRVEFWQEIRANWYVLPVLFLLTLAGTFAGKGFYKLFTRSLTSYTVFGFIIVQIMVSMLLVSLFFMLSLSLLKKYTTRSLDFLLVLDTFINLLLFTLLDISLFPIFLLIYAVSVISLIFRRNWIHIILTVFLIVPFIPYINALFNTSDITSLHKLLINSATQPFLLSFIILPVYLMLLRLFNAFKKYYTKKRLYALVIGCTYLFVFIVLLLLNRIFYSSKKGQDKVITVQMLSEGTGGADFLVSYKDKKIFSDIIRTINLSSPATPVYISLTIESADEQSSPVLYSENDFISLEKNKVCFSLPLYPSENLEFNYGTGSASQTIIVDEIFYLPQNDQYYSLTKRLNIEGSE
ncbi:MAG: hypothetical protein J5726_01525 [Treponema sp.]|nr:hypothetical protein [Treponema sp.]